MEMVIKKVMKSLLKNAGISKVETKGEQDNQQTSSEVMDLDFDSFKFEEVAAASKEEKVVDVDHCSPNAKIMLNVYNLEGTIAQLSKFCRKKRIIEVSEQVEIKKGKSKISANDFSNDEYYESFKNLEGRKVGPFTLNDGADIEIFKVASFMFNSNLSKR